MSEPIDFKQIADKAIAQYERESNSVSFVEALRLVWNARGAADLARAEYELSTLMGSTAADPYIKNLYRALRTLDR